MYKTFEQLGYKAGDTVRCLYTEPRYPSHEVGEVLVLRASSDGPETFKSYLGTLSNWELVNNENKMETNTMAHDYKVGDKVIWNSNEIGLSTIFTKGEEYVITHITETEFGTYFSFTNDRDGSSGGWLPYRFLPVEAPTYTPWGDMTPEQKVEILLASHQGKTIELFLNATGDWLELTHKPELHNEYCYRVKVKEPVVVKAAKHFKVEGVNCKMTYNKIDGVIDYSSAKLVEVKPYVA
jgi:hypothetical protein